MTIKRLCKLQWLERMIVRDGEELARCRAKAPIPSSSNITGMPNAKNGITNEVERYNTTIDEIEKRINRNIKERDRLNRVINDVPDELIQRMLVLHCVKGASWKRVAAIIGGKNTGDTARMACVRYLKKI